MLKAVVPTSKLLSWLYKYGVAALLIFIPLYPKFPLFNVPFTFVAIRAEDFLIASLWVALLAKLSAEKKLKLPTIAPQIFIFIFIGIVSSLSAILVTKNVQPLLVFLHLFRRIEYVSVFFLLYFAGKVEHHRKFFLELILLPSLGVFAYGIAQIYFQAPVISTMDSEASKGIALVLRPGVMLSSTFAGHYDLAVYLTMIMSYVAALCASTKSWIKRLPFIIGFSGLLWLFMQTGSRISIAGLVLSLIVITLLNRQYLLGMLFFVIVGLGILSSPQLISRFQSIFKALTIRSQLTIISPAYAASKMVSPVSITPTPTLKPVPTEALRPIQNDRSTSIRFDVEWPRAMRAFYKNPVFGTGYSSLYLATDNDYLRALGETGILGLLAFVSVLVGVLNSLISRLRSTGIDQAIIIGSIGVFVTFLVTGMFLDVFEASKVAILFWGFMGYAISLKNEKY